MKAKAKLLSVADLLQEVIETTGYVRELEAEGTDEAEARIENIDELISKAVDYAEGEEAPTLNGFLENVALVADIDSFDENSDYVVLMTLHSAKGLEFPNVYLAGLEDGLFPSYMSITVITPSRDRGRTASGICGNYPCKEKSDNHFRACAHGAGADTVWKSIPFCQGNSAGTSFRKDL